MAEEAAIDDLPTDKNKHKCNRVFHGLEAVNDVFNGEIEGAQTHHGEDIAGEDHECICGDGQSCGDAVDREDDVTNLYDNESQKHGRCKKAQIAVGLFALL